MSGNITSARGGEFATSRRGGLTSAELEFIGANKQRFPVSAMAQMLGRPAMTVRAVVESTVAAVERPIVAETPPVAEVAQPPREKRRYIREHTQYKAVPREIRRARCRQPRPLPGRALALVKDICREWDILVEEVVGGSKKKRVVACRYGCYTALYGLKTSKGTRAYSLTAIGTFFSGRDHTSVLSGLKRYPELVAELQPKLAVAA
jgi:hypothetical protein